MPQLRWRTAFTYALVILVVMIALLFFLDGRVGEIYTANALDHFATQASLTTKNPELAIAWAQGPLALVTLLKRWSTLLGGRATA